MRDHSRSSTTKGSLGQRRRKGATVGAQRIAEHSGVPAVVLSAGDGEAVAKAIHLLRVDGVHRKAALEQHLDDRAVRRLDGDCDPRRLGATLVDQPLAQVRQSGAVMRHIPFADHTARAVKQTDAMLFAGPVKSNIPFALLPRAA